MNTFIPTTPAAFPRHHAATTTVVTTVAKKRRGAAPPTPADKGPVHATLASLPGTVLVIPASAVHHRPRASAAVGGAVVATLCPLYSPTDPRSCPRGHRCDNVHADITQATQHAEHRRDACEAARLTGAPLPYATYAASVPQSHRRVVAVAQPNSGCGQQVLTVDVPLDRVLATQALQQPRRPVALCAHWAGPKGVCHLGATCSFVHCLPQASNPDAVVAPHATAHDTAFDATAHGLALLPPAAPCWRFGSSDDEQHQEGEPQRWFTHEGSAPQFGASVSARTAAARIQPQPPLWMMQATAVASLMDAPDANAGDVVPTCDGDKLTSPRKTAPHHAYRHSPYTQTPLSA